MKQTHLFANETQINDCVVNVATVAQRSPFRYPGGKTWLVPKIKRWLLSKQVKPRLLIEPFAGGGIVGLSVAFERLADHVIMVELDDDVASVWKTILTGDGDGLAEKIARFNLTQGNASDELSSAPLNLGDKAFKTILKNRICHGGILAHGAGVIKHGENGKGIRSRWYPETLKKRIQNIIAVRDRITFIEGDGIEVLKKYTESADVVSFVDPPYTAAGKKAGTRLYKHYSIDHNELFETVAGLKGDFLMTYDNAPEIVEMARRFNFITKTIPMKNTHNTTMSEILIARNMDWL